MSNYYNNLNYDYKFAKGDSINMGFALLDSSNNPIDLTSSNTASNFTNIKFSAKDPFTDEIVIYKYHDDSLKGGKGVYINGDTNIPGTLSIPDVNNLAVILDYDDTANLSIGVYPFDIEISDKPTTGDATAKLTPIKGNLILTREVTKSAI